MRAVVVREFGGPEAMEIAEVAVPVPGPGQVRVRVEAAGVNPIDLFTRAGVMVDVGIMAPRAVVGLGWEVAGVIDAVGEGVTALIEGDRVLGLQDRMGRENGAYAEYIVLDADAVAPAPRGVSAEAAVTLPLNALTADQALEGLGLKAGQTLLVTGAAGAVGGFAVQLGAARGLRVVAAAGADDEELVRGFGAEFFVPRSDELADSVRRLVPGGVDGVLDAAVIGLGALDAVRGGGAYAAVGPAGFPGIRGTRIVIVQARADGARLAELSAQAEAGRLSLRVAESYPLAEAAGAHERLAKGGVRGRLVLVP